MARWPPSLAGLAVLSWLQGGARAVEPPPAAPPQPPSVVFQAEATTVEVDVVVTDGLGEPVRGLTRDDFRVFEEGARQEITAFSEVAVPVEDARAARTERWPLPRDVATNEAGGQRRIYVLVLDEAHTDPRRSTVVRTAAGQFIDRHMAPGDVAAVVYAAGGSALDLALTADKRPLTDSVNRFVGRRGPSAAQERARAIDHQRELLEAARDPAEAAVVPRYGVDTDASGPARGHDDRASLATLERVANALLALPGRRKAILFFSEGLDHDAFDESGRLAQRGPEVQAGVRNVVARAARSNVAIYAIDPRGLGGGPGSDMEVAAPPQDRAFGLDARSADRDKRRSQENLRLLAEETGGTAVLDTNDLAVAYERIVRASSHYYLLGYAPSEFRADGAFRRIQVRVSRPGLLVAARKGYARPRLGDRPAPELAAAEGTSPDLRELLHRPWAEPGLSLAMTAAVFRLTADKATVAVTIQVPAEGFTSDTDAGRTADGLELSLIAVDASARVRAGDRMLVDLRGNEEARAAVQRHGLRFVRRLDLPPGAYQVRVAARTTPHARRGSVFQDLRVPRYADAPLAISGVLLTSRAAARTPTPSFDEVVKALLETPPTAARAFTPDDVLTVYSEIYDALLPAHELAVTTRVTSLDGREMLRAADQRPSGPLQAAGGGLRHKHDIRLSGLPPGSYLLRIEARPTAGTEVVARELSFDVLSSMAARGAADVGAPAPSGAVPSWNVRPASRIDRLEAWLAALDGHQPGSLDGPAHMVRLWTPADLADLAADVTVLARVIQDPAYSLTWLVEPTPSGRPQPSPYSSADQRRIRDMAREAAGRCQGEACAQNRIAKRGALLHTDAAVLFEDDGGRPSEGGDRREHIRIRFHDAQQRHTEQSAGHWELAQGLLDVVRPDPRLDETVRLWYLAAGAFGQHHERYTRVEDRASRLFPTDPDVLFLAGTFHETLASARMQGLVRSLRLPAGVQHAIGSERSELRKAEDLFRRALAAQPAAVETRLRLGRVLHRLGRHDQAARELRKAARELPPVGVPGSDDDGLLAYYAEMFLGAAEEALGRHDQARASYERAAALSPAAPTPHLALSRVALSANDRAGAISAARVALLDREREDPWWRYHRVQGRRLEAWLDAFRRSVASER